MAASPAAVPDPQTIAGILAEVKEAAKSSCPPASFRAMQGALLAWTVDGCEPGGWHWFCRRVPLQSLRPSSVVHDRSGIGSTAELAFAGQWLSNCF